MNKIAIVGCPASGKTTLANKLGILLNIPVHHLDKIFWVQKGGIKQDIFIIQQEEIMASEKWIIDGSFTKSLPLRLSKADTIIFFDFPLYVAYWRLIKRFIKHFNTVRPDMGGNNKESLNLDLIKYMWKYPSKDIHSKVLEYSKIKNVIIIHNSKEEKLFLDDTKKSLN